VRLAQFFNRLHLGLDVHIVHNLCGQCVIVEVAAAGLVHHPSEALLQGFFLLCAILQRLVPPTRARFKYTLGENRQWQSQRRSTNELLELLLHREWERWCQVGVAFLPSLVGLTAALWLLQLIARLLLLGLLLLLDDRIFKLPLRPTLIVQLRRSKLAFLLRPRLEGLVCFLCIIHEIFDEGRYLKERECNASIIEVPRRLPSFSWGHMSILRLFWNYSSSSISHARRTKHTSAFISRLGRCTGYFFEEARQVLFCCVE